MKRSQETRPYRTLVLGCLGMAAALASVPMSTVTRPAPTPAEPKLARKPPEHFTDEQLRRFGWNRGSDFFFDPYDEPTPLVRATEIPKIVMKSSKVTERSEVTSGVDESDYTFEIPSSPELQVLLQSEGFLKIVAPEKK